MRPDDPTLSRLMAKVQGGDADAYRALLGMCQQWLSRFFAGRIATASVDDLIQETLASIHAKRATYDPSRPFLPWLAAIARYRWLDHLRRVYRAREEAWDWAVADAGHEMEVVARISIDRMLSRLSPAQSAAIRLVKIDGHSILEASRRTGQSEASVKVNIHRGLKRLAQHVESE